MNIIITEQQHKQIIERELGRVLPEEAEILLSKEFPEFRSWLYGLNNNKLPNAAYHYNSYNNNISLTVRLYTNNNSYNIVASKEIDKNKKDWYLGCTTSIRKPHAGEPHTRGSDFADGKYDFNTWSKILKDIVTNKTSSNNVKIVHTI